ncbi:hypothetical protein [Solirhodobacter olei]|uniref:hypothetical protein n=1 Tax=Solirhodobacter olei TaxID=2493082 RepID=UPI000FD9BB36|nr:hypothetical protein [Solirhodobacter olei]
MRIPFQNARAMPGYSGNGDQAAADLGLRRLAGRLALSGALVLSAAGAAGALSLSLGGVSASVGGTSSGGIAAGASVGGASVGASVGGGSGASVGASVGSTSASASLGGGSGASVGASVGGSSGVGVSASIGSGGVSAGLSVGGSTGGTGTGTGSTGSGGVATGGADTGTLGISGGNSLVGVTEPSRSEYLAARNQICGVFGNSDAFVGQVLFSKDGHPIGVIHATWLSPKLKPRKITFVPLKSVSGTRLCVTILAHSVDTGANGLRLPVTEQDMASMLTDYTDHRMASAGGGA